MWNLAQIKQYIENFDFETIVKESVLKSENDMLLLNEMQMKNFGIDSEGDQIQTYKAAPGEVYAAYTIELKQAKGQRTDIVTVSDSGYFHNSMELFKDSAGLPLLVNNEFPIIADFKKGNENIGDNLDTSNLLGLTDANKTAVINDIQNEIQRKISEIFSNIPKI